MYIPNKTSGEFEDLSLPERQALVPAAQHRHRYERTLLAPSEALNVLSVGAVSLDLTPPRMGAASGTVEIHADGDTLPAISSGLRLGPFRAIKPDRLALIDAKTGPRHALLGEAAQELLLGLAETASGEWVFPGGERNKPLTTNELYRFCRQSRDAAGIVAAARLYDLRHARTSHAVMNGESLLIAGRLLEHRRASTTNRHVHLDDATLREPLIIPVFVAFGSRKSIGYECLDAALLIFSDLPYQAAGRVAEAIRQKLQ